MKITWLGHAAFRIEIEQAVLLVDPWMISSPFIGMNNPLFPADQYAAAIAGATHVLLTHGHADHIGNTVTICKDLGIPLICIADSADWFHSHMGITAIGMNKGGTVTLAGAQVTMVPASHSSSFTHDGAVVYAGAEAGFVIRGETHTIYLSGDTGLMADMDWIGDYFKPDIGILCAGGHYTMDMEQAAYAAKRWFNFKTLIPCHYKTFSALAQDAKPLIDALPDTDVKTPAIMEPLIF